jgi:hypothetical protein
MLRVTCSLGFCFVIFRIRRMKCLESGDLPT